ncbi:GPI transamidase component PIG-S-like [Haliotis cracherodii]|uniref:GPI transamidase component PIG-S-like n=1 Tax=Haliotis cracherodii TaxID=6455 RepID=UPI0039E73B72
MGKDLSEEQEKNTQAYAALGIGLICVIVGLPLWWKTTEVYRVPLPYEEITTLAATKIEYQVNVEVISFAGSIDLSQLSKEVQTSLSSEKRKTLIPTYRISAREPVNEELVMLKVASSIKDLDRKLTSHLGDERNKYFVVLLKEKSKLITTRTFIGCNRITFLNPADQDVATLGRAVSSVLKDVIVREAAVKKSLIAAKGARSLKPDKESMRSLRSTPGYDMTFTLVNPQPDILDVQWDVKAGIGAYLKPFLSKLDAFADFTLTSQVLYFTGLVRRPQRNTVTGDSFYTEQDLPHLITPLESKLGSHTSNNPALNFLVYIPTRDQSPLYVKDKSDKAVASNAFFSPRWGGIWISNAEVPPNSSLPHPVNVDVRKMMEVFITQMRMLLNLQAQVASVDLSFADLENQGITAWEVDAWLRSFCVENIATSAGTLSSLAQLLGEIGNIVIKDDIGTEVKSSVAAIRESLRQLAEGQLEEAFLSSKKALIASEKAFFDPSLLELLYFPEDQKFAIYIPLFLPISIPVFTSLVQAVKWFRSRRKQKKE